MKKLIISLSIIFCGLTLSAQVAKKPIIMVIPSDAYCIRSGYVSTYTNENGDKIQTPNYKTAISKDENMRLVISELSTIMAQRGFPLKDMEQTLKNINNEEIELNLLTSKGGSIVVESPLDQLKRVAKADIIMDIDF